MKYLQKFKIAFLVFLKYGKVFFLLKNTFDAAFYNSVCKTTHIFLKPIPMIFLRNSHLFMLQKRLETIRKYERYRFWAIPWKIPHKQKKVIHT